MRTKTILKDLFVLIILFTTGCSPTAVDKSTPASQFNSIGTAQAQASDLEYSSPPQDILPDFEHWIHKRSFEIKSLDSTDYSDLHFLEPLLEGTRIVQLGEDEHGTVEQSLMKIRLIKYLHQELGYEVIAMETGLLDCYLTNSYTSNLSSNEAMDHIFYGNPQTKDILTLFEYIKETSSSPSPLEIAGFDIISNGEGFEDWTGFYYSLIDGMDTDYASTIKMLEEFFVSTARSSDILDKINDKVGHQEAIKAYEALADYINQNQQTLQRTGLSIELLKVAEQVSWSRARYIEAFQHRTSNQNGDYLTVRDKSMAVNVMFLTEELYPDRKIIIWAHNGHVAEKSPWTGSGVDNMGTYLDQYFGEEIYTIGLIGHRSDDSYWSIENQLHLYGKPYLFVDLSPLEGSVDNSSMPIQLITVSEEYDALIYLDKITSYHVLGNNE